MDSVGLKPTSISTTSPRDPGLVPIVNLSQYSHGDFELRVSRVVILIQAHVPFASFPKTFRSTGGHDYSSPISGHLTLQGTVSNLRAFRIDEAWRGVFV